MREVAHNRQNAQGTIFLGKVGTVGMGKEQYCFIMFLTIIFTREEAGEEKRLSFFFSLPGVSQLL